MDIEKEIKEYIKNHVEIVVDQVTEFGPVECIRVSLELDGEEISYATCSIPESN